MQVRLQKVIAASGLASRRQAETMIRSGQVTVNGEVICTMGVSIDPSRDHVKVDGRHIKSTEPDVFLMLNKPPGCVTSMRDPLGRSTIADLLKGIRARVFPVGRLDYDSEGLLLLTNNGDVAQACLHPRFKIPKSYLVKVAGVLNNQEIARLEQGMVLNDGPTAPARVKKSGKAKVNSWVEMTIHEGRQHQVKRMLEAVGHQVLRLRRVRFGPLSLGDIPIGAHRYLTDKEANALRALLCDSSRQLSTEETQMRTVGHVPPTRSRKPNPRKEGQQRGTASLTPSRRTLKQ